MSNVDWVLVPSIWWENSPLVIQEAFHFRRPVICSDIGGMAEKVTHGVDGLHFRAGDAADLARTLEYAVTTPGLWKQLHAAIRPVYGMEAHVRALESLYSALLSRRKIANVG
jgi:glycosyltransferase involved in cell wall biosynthesis